MLSGLWDALIALIWKLAYSYLRVIFASVNVTAMTSTTRGFKFHSATASSVNLGKLVNYFKSQHLIKWRKKIIMLQELNAVLYV